MKKSKFNLSIIISAVILFSIFILALMPFSGSLKDKIWFFDIFIHFKLHYICSLFLLSLFTAVIRKFILFFLSAAALVFNLFFIDPFPINFKTEKKQISGPDSIKTLFFNIDWHTQNPVKNTGYFKTENPDIILLAEVTPGSYLEYKDLLADYQYKGYVSNPNFDEPFNGMAYFSKYEPLNENSFIYFGEGAIPCVSLNIKKNNKIYTIMGVHPYSPVTKTRTLNRNKQLIKLADYVKDLKGPVILFGDLNTSVWLPEFKHLVKTGNLLNSMDAFGYQPSWPGFAPVFLRIAIDHVLYNKDINLTEKYTGRNMGSDHMPQIAVFE